MYEYVGPNRRDLKICAPHFRYSSKSKEISLSSLPIFSIDPGVTTGWSLLILRRFINHKNIFSYPFDIILKNKIIWEHGQINTFNFESEATYHLSRMIENFPGAAIVTEDFILRSERKEKTRELLSPVRINAKLETLLWMQGRRMFLQQPSLAKTTITDERLKLWGCYTSDGGLVHARDADRHALLFVRRCMGLQGAGLRTAAWPYIFGEKSTSTSGCDGDGNSDNDGDSNSDSNIYSNSNNKRLS